ncbi:MAG: Uma2 family endonuclease [Lewinellaceae bacterium]|nr:Uma2 family endonuclease [Saprospiraceae bacterium]MCB9341283.1 Uma2 family endonuclease [Lewinellaceae bacterium]
MITKFEDLDLSKRYTYADYLTWKFDEMVEIIRGKVFRMAPAPGMSHQSRSGDLYGIIWSYLRDKPCKAFSAPFDVRLPLPPEKQSDDKIDTVVQPDISVICDLAKLDERGCNGAPDWIIEILSMATSKKDLTDKFDLYQHAGVREYWIVHPIEATVIPYRLNEKNEYQPLRPNPFVMGEKVPVGIFEGFSVDLDEVFA